MILKICIGAYLLYNVMLVSAMQQSESAIYMCVYIHIPSFFWISFPSSSPQSIE